MSRVIFSICLLVSVFSFLLSCNRNERFEIKGNLRFVNISKAYLIHSNPIVNTIDVLDSSEIIDGRFSFSGTVSQPCACQIKIGRKTTVNFILENSQIEITGTIQIPEEIKVKGSRSDDDFHHLLDKVKDLEVQKNNLLANMIDKGGEVSRHDSLINNLNDSLLSITKSFVIEHPKSIGAAYFIYYLYFGKMQSIESLASIIESFDEDIKDSEYISYLKDELQYASPIQVGDEIPDFHIRNFEDGFFNKSSFRGKKMYIDFTASWVPYSMKRAERIKRIIKKDSSLCVLSVYLDKDRDKLNEWREKEQISWYEACSFESWETPITKHFRVAKIPYGYLISENGRIELINPSFETLDSLFISNKNNYD